MRSVRKSFEVVDGLPETVWKEEEEGLPQANFPEGERMIRVWSDPSTMGRQLYPNEGAKFEDVLPEDSRYVLVRNDYGKNGRSEVTEVTLYVV